MLQSVRAVNLNREQYDTPLKKRSCQELLFFMLSRIDSYNVCLIDISYYFPFELWI